ncbi:MAG: glycosyltransferase family 2 protein [Clostridiales bacterium]|nr:glycosyltransferase family 2 protein [Clostridiales bacterium]
MATYNNAGTLARVIDEVYDYVKDIIVVNDGSTDDTASILEKKREKLVHVISYSPNRGKGAALQQGIDWARGMGYSHAVTIDSDGQHYPSDIDGLLEVAGVRPESIILGRRGTRHNNMAAQSTFANRFSNFWFAVQTFKRPGDTQTGFRVYPLKHPLRFYTSRYEAELAVLVDACWRGISLISVPIRVYYPPVDKRISHFRPARDFARISLLNTCLCILAVLYGYPSMLYHKIKKWRGKN